MADQLPPGFENYKIDTSQLPASNSPNGLPAGFEKYRLDGPQVSPLLQNKNMKGSVGFNLSDAPRAAAGFAPMVGSMIEPGGGTLIGTGLQQLLRLAAPKTFGEPPQSPTDVFKEAGENVIGQDVIPGTLGKLATKEGQAAILGSKAFRSKLNPISGSVRDAINLDKAGSLADMPVSSGTQIPEATAVQNLMKKGYSPSAKSLDPQAILKELDKNPEGAYNTISPETRQNVTDFLQSVPKTPQPNGLFNYLGHKLVFALPAMAIGHGSLEAEAAGAAGLVLGDKAVSALMSNPNMSRLVVAAAKGELPKGSETFASKLILHALKGTDATILMPDKSEEKVKVGAGGQIQYPQANQ